MGKGDKKSRKGKVWKGTFGVRRRRRALKVTVDATSKASAKAK
ncbi:MAG: 30S ribosomal protein THX [Cytophagales bacterium]